eukprot:4660405-Karenia_brevis.AAC.1
MRSSVSSSSSQSGHPFNITVQIPRLNFTEDGSAQPKVVLAHGCFVHHVIQNPRAIPKFMQTHWAV